MKARNARSIANQETAKPDEPLILVPTIDKQRREEIEAHLDLVRVRRLSAAIQYHEGVQAKLAREDTIIGRRLAQQYHMMEQELERLDRALAKVEDRLSTITLLENNQALNRTMMDIGDNNEQE